MGNQKVIIITGTSKGIGRHLSEYYLAKNHFVCGCSRGDSDIKEDKYSHFCLDVADEKAVKEMVASIRRKFGRIDVLLNNAGIASSRNFGSCSPGIWVGP